MWRRRTRISGLGRLPEMPRSVSHQVLFLDDGVPPGSDRSPFLSPSVDFQVSQRAVPLCRGHSRSPRDVNEGGPLWQVAFSLTT